MNNNLDQITGPLRILLPVLLTYAASRGWLTTDQIGPVTQQIVDAIPVLVTAGSIVWSFSAWARPRLIARVAAMRGVHRVVTDAATANVGPLATVPNVVSESPKGGQS